MLHPETKAALLQVRVDEVSGYTKAHSNTKHLQCESLREGLEAVEPGSYVIIEDIIHLTKKDEQALRALLNYGAHHNKLRVLCVAHLLYRTSLLTLVPLFNYLAFTMSNSSRGLIKTAATYGFNLEPEKSCRWVQSFSNVCSNNQDRVDGKYIFISCNDVRMFFKSEEEGKLVELAKTSKKQIVENAGDDTGDDEAADDDDDDNGEAKCKKSRPGKYGDQSLKSTGRTSGKGGGAGWREPPRTMEQRFADCFSGEREKAPIARAFVSIVSKVLRQEPSFREQDLSLGFKQSRKPGKLKRISVVDYVSSLLDSRPYLPPSRDQLVLHRYLCVQCKIPKLFVKNHYFYEISLDASTDEEDGGDLEEGQARPEVNA